MSCTQQPILMSVREVATALGLGTSTVWRGVRTGALPKPLRIAGSTRWKRSDIEALIEERAAA